MISTTDSRNQIPSLIYKLFHPTVIVFLTPLIISYFNNENLATTAIWTVIFSIIFVVPIYFLYRQFHQRFTNSKNLHTALGISGFILAGLFILLTANYSLPQSFIYCSYTALIGCGIGTILTRFIDLSPHTIFLAGCSTIALISSIPASLIIVAISCLSGWSILTLNKTTAIEMMTTTAIVTLCVVTAFNLM